MKFRRLKSRTLTIFDFDDTLFSTDGHIVNIKTGKIYTTKEFSQLDVDSNDYDFSEFRVPYLIEPITPNKSMIKKYLKAIEQYGINNVAIITARRLDKPVRKCLEKFNLPVVKIYTSNSDNNNAVQKKNILKQLILDGDYSEVIIYDDSAENLRVMRSLSHEMGINITTIQV